MSKQQEPSSTVAAGSKFAAVASVHPDTPHTAPPTEMSVYVPVAAPTNEPKSNETSEAKDPPPTVTS